MNFIHYDDVNNDVGDDVKNDVHDDAKNVANNAIGSDIGNDVWDIICIRKGLVYKVLGCSRAWQQGNGLETQTQEQQNIDVTYPSSTCDDIVGECLSL